MEKAGILEALGYFLREGGGGLPVRGGRTGFVVERGVVCFGHD